ncbi:hypothetical protein WR25_09402 [Diploscapter pachys]|uniref:Uncharacterized protein n=1 Tax=Diploscapter pachys TaxID=2018661 RepID=A0A2A2JUD9_9BILA|nr:hypothetical protein WR25_09402 [Diploscapter pachys]
MIGRLMLLSIDKHLPIGIFLLISSFLIPLVGIFIDYSNSAIPALIISTTCTIQSISSQMILLSTMMLRHQCNMTCPSVPHGVLRPIQASVQGRLIQFAHFICHIGKRIITSTGKIPIVIIYFMATIGYISFIMVRRMYRDSVNRRYLDKNCPDSLCIYVDLSWLSLLAIPLLLFLLASRLSLHSIAAFCSLIASLCIFSSIQGDLSNLTFLHYVLASFLSAHFSIMYCMAYKASRRKSTVSKVLDGLNLIFPASTFSLFSIFIAFLAEYLLNQRTLNLQFALLSAFVWISIVAFLSCAMALFGDWKSCNQKRRSSQQSDISSAINERLSSHHLYESDIRKISATHYYGSGAYKKKSFCSLAVVDENRRASMPAVIHQQIAQKQWTEASKRCRSIDDGASVGGASGRYIKKKETLANSRGSMCSANSKSSNAVIIEE